MKKLFFAALIAALLVSSFAALADPMVSADGYTAYLGDENHLYLAAPDGKTKVLRFPMADVNGIGAEHVYATAQDGSFLAITLDGSETAILPALPADALSAPVWELAEGKLNAIRADGTRLLLADEVTVAAANSTTLFYMQQVNGASTLRSIQLDGLAAAATAPASASIGFGVLSPLAMTASDDALAVLGSDRSVTTISLADHKREHAAAISANTALAVCVDGKLYRYTNEVENVWLLEGNTPSALTMVDVTAQPSATPFIPTQAPTATPRINKSTATPAPDDDDVYNTLHYGDTGSEVRRMQRRLKDLGYPVGSVDGDWGKNTQLAVNLFQFFVNHKERSYITSATLEKLYSSRAPKYDQFKALKSGNSGTPVLLMQERLYELGYFGFDHDEVDGHYGPKTSAAVMAFQQAVIGSIEFRDNDIQPTGKADRATLKALFSTLAPMAPLAPGQVTPPLVEFITPPPTDDLVDVITPPPSGDLVEVITPPPSAEPSKNPIDSLVDEIIHTNSSNNGGVDFILPGGN